MSAHSRIVDFMRVHSAIVDFMSAHSAIVDFMSAHFAIVDFVIAHFAIVDFETKDNTPGLEHLRRPTGSPPCHGRMVGDRFQIARSEGGGRRTQVPSV